MTRKKRVGWRGEAARHSLAARGVKTRCRSPSKSVRHGPRATTVKKWIDDRLEAWRKKLNRQWGSEFFQKDNNWMVTTEIGKDDAGDYVELRTDSTAYEILYDPQSHDFAFMEKDAEREFFEPFRKKFPGMHWEHMGGGVLRAYLWNYNPLSKYEAEGEAEAIEAMERKISKYETDYTGEYTRGH